jgi:hypothetical protein
VYSLDDILINLSSIFPRHRATRSEYLPLPLSGALFDTISSTFQLNESFLAILGSNMATVLQSPSIDSTSSMLWSGLLQTFWVNQHQTEFVLQENMSYINFSMAITHDPIDKLTTGLVFGLSDNLMPGLSNDSISTFIEYIEASKALVAVPMLIPILAKEALALTSNLNAESCHDSVYQIEMSTKMRKKTGHLEGAWAEIPDWSQLDLLDTTRSLNSACTELAWGSLDAKSSISLLRFLEKVNRSYCPEFDTAIRNISSKDDLFVAVSTLSVKNEYLQSWYRGIEERCQYLEKRAQAQVQTVRFTASPRTPSWQARKVYSLIAQKDNSLSIDIAEASRRISEASRHDNILMKALAEDSKSVALATARDSAAMRVIAVVTILFLPATFTAVSNLLTICSSVHINLFFARPFSAQRFSISSLKPRIASSPAGFGYTLSSQCS